MVGHKCNTINDVLHLACHITEEVRAVFGNFSHRAGVCPGGGCGPGAEGEAELAMVALVREDHHQLSSCRSRRPAGSGTARVVHSPIASIATHAASATLPADAVLSPRWAAGACRGLQHQAYWPVLSSKEQ